MSNRTLSTGAAVPGNWTSALGVALGQRAERADFVGRRGERVFVKAIERQLSEALSPELTGWPVRDQGRRATCTAFAVTAMAELWQATHGGKPVVPDFSEEFLYYKSREDSFAGAGIHLDDAEVDALTQAGATFLKQAQNALERDGICLETAAPYDRRAMVNARVKPGQGAVADALGRKPRSALVHNIVDSENGEVIGTLRAWRTPLAERTVSDILIDALGHDSAVAAAFAVLNGPGRGAWLGTTPFLTGQVSYPHDEEVVGLQPIGGHAVCIVGFIPDTGATPAQPANPGWFVFRNSLGRHRFARDAGKVPTPTAAPLQGYGVISAADVDRYCWEYLFHAPGADSVPG
ncbi:hypothetical protein VK792_17820 [Mesobacterium sp. TK19101]|uniref:Peptidase C1A papain C-terminal domain-containing protein n=1 Tax=Mesobacterium hydrothermale TaxID=3111907 RepID=A0ABU6HMT6_9RHOB|nr:hypothetical protein [Mesobacterium sp. TK19101]MEC3863155.1 hypothetical protein [Mesobacterium sp. TK19101]